jgi:hypothetical protein
MKGCQNRRKFGLLCMGGTHCDRARRRSSCAYLEQGAMDANALAQSLQVMKAWVSSHVRHGRRLCTCSISIWLLVAQALQNLQNGVQRLRAAIQSMLRACNVLPIFMPQQYECSRSMPLA